jgi:rod shape-determining protein MreD
VTVVVLLAIFREAAAAYTVRALLPVIVPHALATAVVSPLVFAVAERVHTLTLGLVRPDGGAR